MIAVFKKLKKKLEINEKYRTREKYVINLI